MTEVVRSTGRTYFVRTHGLFHCIIELERYADKYRPTATLQPKLERRNLHQPFFPQEVFEGYFDSKKRRKGTIFEPFAVLFSYPFIVEKKAIKRINLDDLEDNAEEEVVCSLPCLNRYPLTCSPSGQIRGIGCRFAGCGGRLRRR